MLPSIPDRDHTAQTNPDTDTRRASYLTALAAVEYMLAASPVTPTTVGIDCYRWAPTAPKIDLNFHRWPEGVEAFAEAMGAAAATRPHTDEPGAGSYTEASGDLNGIRWLAWSLMPAVAKQGDEPVASPRGDAGGICLTLAPSVAAQLHELEDPSVEDAFAHLAIDHPDAVSASLTRPEVAR